MECSRHFPSTFPMLTGRFPVPFERTPERFPILGRGFHYRFLDLLLDQPSRQLLQLLRVASVPALLKLVFLFDFHISHHHRQLLFMDINSGYPIRHRLPPGGSGERAGDFIKQGLAVSPLPQGERQRTIYSLYHARSGSDRRSVSASPLITQSRQLPTIPDYRQPPRNFHEISRARKGPALTGVCVEKVPQLMLVGLQCSGYKQARVLDAAVHHYIWRPAAHDGTPFPLGIAV